jgi:MFS family permease
MWSVAATVVIWTFGEMFFFPSMAAYVTDIAPEARRGEYMGLSQMVMGLAFMAGPWGGMLILAHFGGKALWAAMFLLGAGAAVIMSRLEQPQHVAEVAAVPAPTTTHSAEP